MWDKGFVPPVAIFLTSPSQFCRFYPIRAHRSSGQHLCPREALLHCLQSPISLIPHKMQSSLCSQAKYKIMSTTEINTQTKLALTVDAAHYHRMRPSKISIITPLLTELKTCRPLCCSLNTSTMFLSWVLCTFSSTFLRVFFLRHWPDLVLSFI